MNNPSISFKKLPRVLSPLEKRLILIFGIVAVAAGLTWWIMAYWQGTKPAAAPGGSYTEGVLGQPKFINPIIAQPNTVDADLCSLIYSSLFRYSPRNELEPELAADYQLNPDGKEITLTLKPDIKWQDGESLTADDVVFTIQSIQNPSIQSPLKSAFADVTVEKIDQQTIKFRLAQTYAPFLSNLTFGILPKHLWERIEPANMSLAELNLQPVGSGPYKFKEFKKNKLGEIQSYTLERFPKYFAAAPYLDQLVFEFYATSEELSNGLTSGQIAGMAFDLNTAEAVYSSQGLNSYQFSLPRYNAIFLNYAQNKDLEYKKVRQALQKAINRDEMQEQALLGQGKLVDSPIMENFLGADPEFKYDGFDPETAKKLLEEAGWKETDAEGYRLKDGQRLVLTLTVSDFPEHLMVADYVVNAWKNIGVEAKTESFSPADIQERIRNRTYDALLFGQVTGHDPDPYPFWHSSQREDPGLNLTALKDGDIDKLLEEGRTTIDSTVRAEKYRSFQQKLAENYVAIFLYSPYYNYTADQKIKGLNPGIITNPAERFSDIENWYSKTKRVAK
mgnify:CR=1 FL=1